MLKRFAARRRAWLHVRDQRRRDEAWLNTDPGMDKVLQLRNERRTEYARWQTGVRDEEST